MTMMPGPCERLAQSRERLRQALHECAAETGNTETSRPNSIAGQWASMIQTIPGAGLLLDVFQSWWNRQPLRVALILAKEAATMVLQPVATRHPYALVASAATVGGVLMLVRPWRWISTSTLLAGLLPQLMSEVMKRMPTQFATQQRHRSQAPAER